ncbi:MAG TPA: chemotaxis protein CheX [Candidatus Brocadiales bacterium]|nr:chemotaxis protein CheX [Candidatus Brocadiales bacterium]
MQAVAEGVVETIVEATKSVFNTMISMDVEPGAPFYQDERMIKTDIMALVGFTGKYNGTISIFCHFNMALKIASNMLGMPLDVINGDVKDAVGEVANIIAGNVKTKLTGTFGEMMLTIPLVIAGNSLSISTTVKEYEMVVVSSLSCTSKDSWLMIPFDSEREKIHVGLMIRKIL